MSWETVYLENRILSANPVGLVNILYEYAILRTQTARLDLAKGDIPARSKAISKVIAILGELDRSLDHKQGGEIATNLARLYRYMRERLTFGNMTQSDAPLAEVERLLTTLHEGWQAIQEDPRETPDGSEVKYERIPVGRLMAFEANITTDYAAHSWSA